MDCLGNDERQLVVGKYPALIDVAAGFQRIEMVFIGGRDHICRRTLLNL